MARGETQMVTARENPFLVSGALGSHVEEITDHCGETFYLTVGLPNKIEKNKLTL